jgi:hypothetical protein
VYNKYFSLESDSEEFINEKSSESVFVSKYLNRHCDKIKSLSEDLLRLPTAEEMFFLQTDRFFNAFTFIPLIAKNQRIKELYISASDIDLTVINALFELQDYGLIDSIFFVISNFSKDKTIHETLYDRQKSNGNLFFKYNRNNTKICLMLTDRNYFVVEGSGNWSESKLMEQYCFINSKEIFDFRKKLFTE